jgi:hypothetical protein
VLGKLNRGFESHPLRHQVCISLSNPLVGRRNSIFRRKCKHIVLATQPENRTRRRVFRILDRFSPSLDFEVEFSSTNPTGGSHRLRAPQTDMRKSFSEFGPQNGEFNIPANLWRRRAEWHRNGTGSSNSILSANKSASLIEVHRFSATTRISRGILCMCLSELNLRPQVRCANPE